MSKLTKLQIEDIERRALPWTVCSGREAAYMVDVTEVEAEAMAELYREKERWYREATECKAVQRVQSAYGLAPPGLPTLCSLDWYVRDGGAPPRLRTPAERDAIRRTKEALVKMTLAARNRSFSLGLLAMGSGLAALRAGARLPGGFPHPDAEGPWRRAIDCFEATGGEGVDSRLVKLFSDFIRSLMGELP